jgi:hypothetical protein
MIFRFVGDPVELMLNEQASQPSATSCANGSASTSSPSRAIRDKFVGNALRGDFGISYRNQQDVFTLIAERFPATLRTGDVCATFLSLVVGIPLRRLHRHPRATASSPRAASSSSRCSAYRCRALRSASCSSCCSPCTSAMAARLRARRGGADRLAGRPGLLTPSGAWRSSCRHHALAVPDHARDAPGASGDAGDDAHGLHPLRPRARSAQPGRAFPPCAPQLPDAGDHRHRACRSAISSPSRW